VAHTTDFVKTIHAVKVAAFQQQQTCLLCTYGYGCDVGKLRGKL